MRETETKSSPPPGGAGKDLREFWTEDLTEERTEEIVEKVVGLVRRFKMEMPAMLLLESHRPVMNLGSHAFLAMSPFVAPFVGFKNVDEATQLMSKPQALDRLVERLEQSANERRKEKG